MCVFVWWMNESFTILGSERDLISCGKPSTPHHNRTSIKNSTVSHDIVQLRSIYQLHPRSWQFKPNNIFFSLLFLFLFFDLVYFSSRSHSFYLSRALHDSPRPEKTKTLLGSGFKKIKSEGENCIKRHRIEARSSKKHEWNSSEFELGKDISAPAFDIIVLSPFVWREWMSENDDIRQRIQRRCKHVLWMMRHSDMVLWNV